MIHACDMVVQALFHVLSSSPTSRSTCKNDIQGNKKIFNNPRFSTLIRNPRRWSIRYRSTNWCKPHRLSSSAWRWTVFHHGEGLKWDQRCDQTLAQRACCRIYSENNAPRARLPQPQLQLSSEVGFHTATTPPSTLSCHSLIDPFNRLLTWYAILTILFRCPSTREACDETSPRICAPYFQVKDAVSPHLEPYYDAYAAPYVDVVRPYYDTLDRTVISPGWGYASRYGAPRVAQAQAYGWALWENNVQPQLLGYQSTVKARYDQTLSPHVARLSNSVGPYYDLAMTNALQTYYEFLLPSYEFLQPYVQQSYRVTSAFVTDTAVPSAAWVWTKTYVFLDGTVWPQLRIIYVENVEPQLVRIGQRLGRHNEKTLTQKPTVESTTSLASTAASSFTKPAGPASSTPASSGAADPSSSTSPETSSEQTVEQTHAATESARLRNTGEQVQAPESEQGENEVRRTAREIVAADLRDWQERYSKAADEGAAEIEERVAEISERIIRKNAMTRGKALVEQLQSTVISELVSLRRHILNIAGAVAKGTASTEQGQEQTTIVVRRAGVAIKAKAKEVRAWREAYENELQTSITMAAQDHFTILNEIRDLAIQKLGMKWAWTDGITYKDWAKYHQLKKRFTEWQSDLEDLILTHPSLKAAQLEGANVEDGAMSIAQEAAKELARLKQVANWKIVANDDTKEFDSELMKQAAEAAEAAKAAEEAEKAKAAEEAVADESTEKAEPATDEAASVFEPADASEATVPVEELVQSAASIVSRSVASASSAGTVVFDSSSSADEGAASTASDDATSASEGTSLPAPENLEASGSETISMASEEATSVVEQSFESTGGVSSGAETAIPEDTDEPSHDASDIASEASTAIIIETPVVVETVTELDEDGPAPVESSVEEPETEETVIIEPTEEDSAEDDSTEDDSTEDELSDEELPLSSTTTSVKPALFGAAAQSVPSREPIFDDDAFDNAASSMESIRNDLPSAFSSMAHSAYSAAISRANNQYSQALSVVSAHIRGTPEPMHQQMLASVTSAYSNAIAAATSHLDDALKAAQEQLGATPTTKNIVPTAIPTPSVPTVDWSRIESIASERLRQGRDWAEEQYESARIAIGVATPTPSTPAEHAEKLLDSAKHNYYAGLGVAHARYAEFVEAASAAFSSMTAAPTPTDFAGSASSMASVAGESAASAGEAIADSWDAALSKISVQVYGAPTPTPWYESLYSAAGDYAASATSAAGDGAASATRAAEDYVAAAEEEAARQYSSVISIVSELVVGREQSFSESVYSRLDAVYSGSVATASGIADAAQAEAEEAAEAARSASEQVASAVSEATEAVKETAGQEKDEL